MGLGGVLTAEQVRRPVNTRAQLIAAPEYPPRGLGHFAAEVCAEVYRVLSAAFTEFRAEEFAS